MTRSLIPTAVFVQIEEPKALISSTYRNEASFSLVSQKGELASWSIT